MIDNYRDFLQELSMLYYGDIRPLITKGDYETAKAFLRNTEVVFQNCICDSIDLEHSRKGVHSESNVLNAVKSLYEKLDKESFDPNIDLRNLENYFMSTTFSVEDSDKRATSQL